MALTISGGGTIPVYARLDYVGGADEFVAYVDISEFWSSGYDPDKIISALADASDYDKVELLYQNGLSATYLISK